MNKDISDMIVQLGNFQKAIQAWECSGDPVKKATLRSYINQNSSVVQKIIAQTGCFKRLTVSPPPAVGGMIMQNLNPFDVIFLPPYSMNIVPIISDIIDQAIGILKTDPPQLKRMKLEPTEIVIKEHYVDPTRIRELETISSRKFDTSKLVKLCKELNIANKNSCYMTIAILTRTIIDHVPPLLDMKTFSEVANNYQKSTKSFKKSMKQLQDSMRNISDSVLHTTIRKKESIPTFVQVDFSADLDVLFGEIVRVNKK